MTAYINVKVNLDDTINSVPAHIDQFGTVWFTVNEARQLAKELNTYAAKYPQDQCTTISETVIDGKVAFVESIVTDDLHEVQTATEDGMYCIGCSFGNPVMWDIEYGTVGDVNNQLDVNEAVQLDVDGSVGDFMGTSAGLRDIHFIQKAAVIEVYHTKTDESWTKADIPLTIMVVSTNA